MHKMKNGIYVIERVVRGRWAALERETLIKRMAEDTRKDLSPLGVGVIDIEPGSGGKESAVAPWSTLLRCHLSVLATPGPIFIASSSLLKIEASIALISNSVPVSKTPLSKSMHWVQSPREPIGQHPDARQCRVLRGRPTGNDVAMHLGRGRRFTPSRQHAAAWPVREVSGTISVS
jgi:hypothetical protein